MPPERPGRSDAAGEHAVRLAPDVSLRLRGGGLVDVTVDGRTHVADMRVLRILEQFAQPKPLGAVIDGLKALGIEEYIETTSLLLRLRDEGVLVDEDAPLTQTSGGFAVPSKHVGMLDDTRRTETFVRAIRATVRPGDVVVDVGSGTGILAVAAARAGASRVYAIEECEIGDAAREVFAANGVADRVVLVQGRSTRVDLPERADVLVSEVLGNDPLAEDVVSIFADARRRLLRPDARIVPASVGVFALPVDLPPSFLNAQSFTQANVDRWRGTLGIDFTPLVAFGARIVDLPFVAPQAVRAWSVVADPIELARVDLRRDEDVADAEATFIARAAAQNLGFVLYFDAQLAPGIVLSTSPVQAADDNSWTCHVFRATGRAAIAPGETARVSFSAKAGVSVLRSDR